MPRRGALLHKGRRHSITSASRARHGAPNAIEPPRKTGDSMGTAVGTIPTVSRTLPIIRYLLLQVQSVESLEKIPLPPLFRELTRGGGVFFKNDKNPRNPRENPQLYKHFKKRLCIDLLIFFFGKKKRFSRFSRYLRAPWSVWAQISQGIQKKYFLSVSNSFLYFQTISFRSESKMWFFKRIFCLFTQGGNRY